MESDNFIDKTYEIIDRNLRSASIAEIGGPVLPNKKCMSWYGGRFVGLPEETWPETENGPMLPLLQVQIKDLPFIPEALNNIKLLTVYLDSTRLPTVCPLVNGSGWVIRTYESLEKLKSLQQPKISGALQPSPIQWHLSSTDSPTMGDSERLIADKRFFEFRQAVLIFHDRYEFHLGTKVGGWPGWTRGSLADPDGYALQVASELEPTWIFGEEGKCYIFYKKGEWLLYWDHFEVKPRVGGMANLRNLKNLYAS